MVQVNSQLKFDPFGRKKLWFLFNFLGFFPVIISFDYVFQEADEPVLECLTDVTVTFAESSPMGFTLHFHFRWVLYCIVVYSVMRQIRDFIVFETRLALAFCNAHYRSYKNLIERPWADSLLSFLFQRERVFQQRRSYQGVRDEVRAYGGGSLQLWRSRDIQGLCTSWFFLKRQKDFPPFVQDFGHVVIVNEKFRWG